MNFKSYEIQDISSEYRNVARRLSRTDYSQCDANLKRFISTIESNPLLLEFITRNNTKKYDIAAIIKARSWLAPFEISADVCEEISFEYQLLKYSLENFKGDFTRSYGGFIYTGANSTRNDEMQKFIEHIIDPLIDHISEYLRICYKKAVREEAKNNPSSAGIITANYSTVVVGSDVYGGITTHNIISSDTQKDAINLITEIKDILDKETLDNKDDILEIVKHIEEDIKESKKPKKGFLTALKPLCSGSAAIASLIAALMKLFSGV